MQFKRSTPNLQAARTFLLPCFFLFPSKNSFLLFGQSMEFVHFHILPLFYPDIEIAITAQWGAQEHWWLGFLLAPSRFSLYLWQNGKKRKPRKKNVIAGTLQFLETTCVRNILSSMRGPILSSPPVLSACEHILRFKQIIILISPNFLLPEKIERCERFERFQTSLNFFPRLFARPAYVHYVTTGRWGGRAAGRMKCSFSLN